MNRSCRSRTVVLLLVAGLGLTSCASQAGSDHVDEPLQSTHGVPSGPVPSFSGPWAAEFASAYRSTTSSLVHDILAKGSITDQDYAAVSDEYVTCMKNRGYAAHIDGPAGESTVSGGPVGGDANAANTSCNGDLAVIAALRADIVRNPEHQDEDTIMAACLVKKGLVPTTYTAHDYAASLQTQKFPFSTASPRFLSCTSDPLGLAAAK